MPALLSKAAKAVIRAKRAPREVFLYRNGLVAVVDADGKQLIALQGRFSSVVAVILELADETTVFNGWPDIVDGGHLGDWRFP